MVRDEGAPRNQRVERKDRKESAAGKAGRGTRPGWRGGPRPRPGHLAVAVVPQALREVQAGGVPGRRGVEPHIHAGAGAGGRGPGLELAGAATRLLAAARSTVGDARPGAPGDSARAVELEGRRAGAADEPGSCGRRTQRRGHASRGRAGGGPGDAPHRDTEAGCARAGGPGRGAQRGDPGRPASSGARRGWDGGGGGGGWPRSSSPGGLSRGAAETRGPAPPLPLPLLPPPVPSPRRRRSAPPTPGSWRAARPAGALGRRPPPGSRPAPRPVQPRPPRSPLPASLRPTPSLPGPLCPHGLTALLAPRPPSAAPPLPALSLLASRSPPVRPSLSPALASPNLHSRPGPLFRLYLPVPIPAGGDLSPSPSTLLLCPGVPGVDSAQKLTCSSSSW